MSVTLLLAGCATVVPPPAAAPVSATEAEAAWGRVLQRFVNERGEVDFQALSQDRADLDRYLRYVADTALAEAGGGMQGTQGTQAAQLAHMVNAYNALSMFNVVASGMPATHAGFNKITFFYLRKLAVGGQVMSLCTFENEVIRPITRRIGEPRVHFALNRIDVAARTVWLSEILNFYPEDFVPDDAPNLQTPRQLPSAMNATNAHTADRVPPSPAALRPSPTGALCRRVRAWNGTCWRRHPGGDRAGARSRMACRRPRRSDRRRVLNALVEATPISTPARVMYAKRHSRTIALVVAVN